MSNLRNVRNDKTGKVLKHSLDKFTGYEYAKLRNEQKLKHNRIHELVALAFIPNSDNKPVVDNIYNIRIDNRIENLRWATLSENGINSTIPSNKTSGYKGVSCDKHNNKWEVRIIHEGNQVCLGRYDGLDEAIKARVDASNKCFGDSK